LVTHIHIPAGDLAWYGCCKIPTSLVLQRYSCKPSGLHEAIDDGVVLIHIGSFDTSTRLRELACRGCRYWLALHASRVLHHKATMYPALRSPPLSTIHSPRESRIGDLWAERLGMYELVASFIKISTRTRPYPDQVLRTANVPPRRPNEQFS
jgi:hypothetical protein